MKNVSVETSVYLLTEKQYEEMKVIREKHLNGNVSMQDAFHESLDFIRENGKFRIELDDCFNY